MGTAGYYRSTRYATLVKKSTIGALGMLCWYSSVLHVLWGGCAGTIRYYTSTRETALVK